MSTIMSIKMFTSISTKISTKILFCVFAFVLMTTSGYAEYMPTAADNQLIERVGTKLIEMAQAKGDVAGSRFLNQMIGALDRIKQKNTLNERLTHIISGLQFMINSVYSENSDVQELNNTGIMSFQKMGIPFTFEYDSTFGEPQVEMIITNKGGFLKPKNGVFDGSLPEQGSDFDTTQGFEYQITTDKGTLHYVSENFNSDAFRGRLEYNPSENMEKVGDIIVDRLGDYPLWDSLPAIAFRKYSAKGDTFVQFDLMLVDFHKDVQGVKSECYTMGYDDDKYCKEIRNKTDEFMQKSIEKYKSDASIHNLLNSAKEIK